MENKENNIYEQLLYMSFDNYLKHIGGRLKRNRKEKTVDKKKEKSRLRELLDEEKTDGI